jgi:hypothetical protein
MAESFATKWEYEAKIAKRFSFAQQHELPMPMPASQKKVAPIDFGLTPSCRHSLFDIASEFA